MLSACQTARPEPKTFIPQVAVANPVFADQTAGIAFQYPRGWVPHEKGDQIIFSIASGQSVLDLTYPKLPFHIPNLIPIGRVRSGYVDSIKTGPIRDAVDTDPGPVNIPDATTSRVKLSGHADGKSAINEAVLIVHADHVYILSVKTDDGGYAAARAALEMAVKSLHWTK